MLPGPICLQEEEEEEVVQDDDREGPASRSRLAQAVVLSFLTCLLDHIVGDRFALVWVDQ